MGRSQKSKRQGWFCTDEACAWFGGKVFSPITGQKFDIINVKGARDNVVKAFREASWRGNTAKTGREWLPGGLVRLFRQETATQLGKDAPVYLPQVKGPSRMGMFDKNKSISGNKKNFKKACDKEKAREWTPLGFIVGVDATRESGPENIQNCPQRRPEVSGTCPQKPSAGTTKPQACFPPYSPPINPPITPYNPPIIPLITPLINPPIIPL